MASSSPTNKDTVGIKMRREVCDNKVIFTLNNFMSITDFRLRTIIGNDANEKNII